MAAPTQELPPWLSYSTSIVTRPGGGALTSSTLLQLPLTYYGPSIPLGTDGAWTYGGLTSPASNPTPTPTSSRPTATPTTTPTITSRPPPPSSPATPSSTFSVTTPTSSLASTSAIPSSSSSLSITPTASTSSTAIPTASSSNVSSSSTTSGLSSSSQTTLSSTTSNASSSSSSIVSSSSLSPAPSSTSTQGAVPSSSSHLSKGALIGIIVGSIFGALLLLLCLLLCLRWRRRRQNGGYQTPIWTGWEIVDPTAAEHASDADEEDRPAGEGSPRGSGEEADSFLRRSGGATDATTMADTSARLVSVPAAAALAGGAVGAGAAAGYGSGSGSNGNNGTNSSGGSGPTESTAVSDYGVLLHGSDYTDDPEGNSPTHVPARPSTDMDFIGDSRGHIIPPSELLRMEREREEEEQLMRNEAPSAARIMRNDPSVPEHYSPLLPPPPLDPDQLAHLTGSKKSSAASIASATELDNPMVMTASRVRMSQVGPRSPPDLGSDDSHGSDAGPSSGGGGWGSLGLGGIARLSRLSWFKNFRETLGDSPTRSNPNSRPGSRPGSFVGRVLTDYDIESGRALLSEDMKRGSSVGLNAQGERPKSSVSAKSGSTVYHDAYSNPSTPPPIPPLPRAHVTGSQTDLGQSPPPAYVANQAELKPSHIPPRMVDVLDMPAPASISQFSSASSRGGMPFPPGLVQLPTPRSWYESSSSEAGDNAGITIDVLEDEPPRAGDGWRVLARNASLMHPEHRTSFGMPQFVHQHDLTAVSEVGSLHSMRSHLSPFSGRSTNSVPASSRHNLDGSNSSRPSGHSHAHTASTGDSLAHSGSISSDGHRRAHGAISPAVSAFGHQDSPSSMVFPTPPPPPPPYLPRSPLGGPQERVREPTLRSVMTGASAPSTADTEITRVAQHDTGDSQLLSMPWATGLDDE